jgi:hypothetical protein
MFQRPMSDVAISINQIEKSGDFFYMSEPEATARRFAEWRKHAMIGDLATIAAKWFRKSPRQIPSSISIEGQHGAIKEVPLVGHSLVGAW